MSESLVPSLTLLTLLPPPPPPLQVQYARGGGARLGRGPSQRAGASTTPTRATGSPSLGSAEPQKTPGPGSHLHQSGPQSPPPPSGVPGARGSRPPVAGFTASACSLATCAQPGTGVAASALCPSRWNCRFPLVLQEPTSLGGSLEGVCRREPPSREACRPHSRAPGMAEGCPSACTLARRALPFVSEPQGLRPFP